MHYRTYIIFLKNWNRKMENGWLIIFISKIFISFFMHFYFLENYIFIIMHKIVIEKLIIINYLYVCVYVYACDVEIYTHK